MDTTTQWNDCIRLTRDYLKKMEYQQIHITNLRETMAELEKKMGSAKIASYDSIPGGSSELNSVEAGAEEAMRYRKLKEEVEAMERHQAKVKRCIEQLPLDEKLAVEMFYFYRRSYDDMVSSLHLSYSTCRRRVRAGTYKIAYMMFGDRAEKKVLFLS